MPKRHTNDILYPPIECFSACDFEISLSLFVFPYSHKKFLNLSRYPKPPPRLLIRIQTPDVEPRAGHGPGMDGGAIYEVVGEVARGVGAAAVGEGGEDEREVFFAVDVEGRDGPVGDGDLRLFLHLEDAHLGVDFDDAGALEFVDFRFVVAHNHGSAFAVEFFDEAPEAEVEEVVGGKDEEVVVDAVGFDGEDQVADGAEAGGVGGGAVVEDADGEGMTGRGPGLKDGGEFTVGDDDVAVDAGDGVDVVQEPAQDGALPYLKQRLGEVFRQRIEAGGVARG